MKEELEKAIRQKVEEPLAHELAEILSVFEVKKFRKGEFLKKPFSISKELFFLVEGDVRGLFYKTNGDESTFRLLPEKSFVSDIISTRTQQATPIGFECMGNVTLLVASHDKVFKLLKTNLALNIVLRESITESAVELGRRFFTFVTGSAKERYNFLLEFNPEILQKVPLHQIASMIGVTPTQLSRIRNQR